MVKSSHTSKREISKYSYGMIAVEAFHGRINRRMLKSSYLPYAGEYLPVGDIDKNTVLKGLFRIVRNNTQKLRRPNRSRNRLLLGTTINQEEFESIWRVLGSVGFGTVNSLTIWEKIVRYRDSMYGVYLMTGGLNPSIIYHPYYLRKGMSEYEAEMKGYPVGSIKLTQKAAEQYLPNPERRLLKKLGPDEDYSTVHRIKSGYRSEKKRSDELE
jgi:hypothetical protein